MRSLFLPLALSACSCSQELETEVAETGSAIEEVDDRSWVTWDTCGHKPGENPCNFELVNQHGELVELYDYHGKVIVIDLSTMWCSVCVQIATKGDELTAEYGSENFVWLTLLVENSSGADPTIADLEYWASAHGISSNVLGADRSLVDLNAVTGYPVTGWPTLAIIDQNMVLYNGINGWNESTIRSWPEHLLAQ